VIAVDTNILVYAHRQESEWHQSALTAMMSLAEGQARWAIPWPCVHEFVAITTHPEIWQAPTPLDVSMSALDAWLDLATCSAIGEGPSYFSYLKDLALRGRVTGPKIHDARVAAICIYNGVDVLWSADRDFSRFSDLRTENPLL
jgi:predicted nucleic acid-binding protein